MKCSICGNECVGESHNASPVSEKSCCDKCNTNVVLPIRLFQSGAYPNHALLITTDGTIKFLKPKGRTFELKEVKSFVQGYIEIYPIDIPNCVVVVNEEGLIHELPFNRIAQLTFGIEAVGPVLVSPLSIFE